MNKKSRVYVSGANGNLGSEIVNRLSVTSNTEVIALKRDSRNSYIEDLLRRDDDSFIGKKSFIHCGWNVTNRTLEAQKLSAQDTEYLSKICNLRSITMIFLSSASANSESLSNYGAMKCLAEKSVSKSGGIVLRPGLVLFSSPKGIQQKLENLSNGFVSVRFLPNIPVSTIGIIDLLKVIECILHRPDDEVGKNQLRNIFVPINTLCRPLNTTKRRVYVYIPIKLLNFVLKYLGVFNKNLASIHDSVKSVYAR